MKVRIHKKENYKGIFIDNKTIRVPLDSSKPVLELEYPEFYDVSITDKCHGACPYCYQNSLPNLKHYDKIITKVRKYFGDMTPNQRPFQVALGGGEPTEHPKFIRLLKVLKEELDILPNYTTNGMWITKKYYNYAVLKATKKYCGGVALSTHPHLRKYWEEALKHLTYYKIPTNLHIIISDKKSIDEFIDLYQRYKDIVYYFVLLPYEPVGRAKVKVNIDYDYLFDQLPLNTYNIAFGANLYEELLKRDYPASLYEPEMFSKYLSLKDNGYLYPSSFKTSSDDLIKSNFLL